VRRIDLLVPDLGDFKDVEVIDVLVKPGARVALDDALITLETDKATMDVPATSAGVIEHVLLKKGDRVSKGSRIVSLRTDDVEGTTVVASSEHEQPYVETVTLDEPTITPVTRVPGKAPSAKPAPSPQVATKPPEKASAGRAAPPVLASSAGPRLVVIGAGPGGYTAAFRAADLGLKVTLIERSPTLGGVCLNVGCIPSKALLHAAKVIEEANSMKEHGIAFGTPKIDREKLRAWKDRVVGRLTGGLASLAKQRKVEVVTGAARFVDAHHVTVGDDKARRTLEFDQCVIAAGSESTRLPGFPDDPRIMDSSGALELPDKVKRLLVVGGGIIGLEMACVYEALGARVSVVELTDSLLPGVDRDLVRPLEKRIQKRYEQIILGARVERIEPLSNGLRVSFKGKNAPEPHLYDRVLVAVGRTPNGKTLKAEAAGVNVDERGFIRVDRQQRTNVAHIFAIGDIVGPPMLAHKASHEGKVAAEVAAGLKRGFDARAIPSVAYTDPEVAWVGLTETEARQQGVDFGRGVFPWVASGRSLSLDRDDGMTRILFDNATHRVLGAGIVGPNAGDLISEVALAIEMGCDAADVGLTVHPHPTLSETIAFAAEAYEGTLTDLYMPKTARVTQER
jgi:dihydrolipoamide dehydrogenase